MMQPQQTEALELFEAPLTRQKGVTIDDIISLKLTNPNMTAKQGAKLLNCSVANIYYHLDRAGHTWDSIITELKTFDKTESKLLSYKCLQALKSLNSDKVKDASAYQLSLIYCQLRDKKRLLDGQSTENIAYSDESANLEEIEKELAELETLRLRAKE